MPARNAFCSEASLEDAEPLAGTAGRVDHWILVEYRAPLGYDALVGSGLSDRVKVRLREQADARPLTKLVFVRRTKRRGSRGLTVLWGSSPERGGSFSRAEFEGYDELLELDLTEPGEPVGHPLILVCTHGKHDRCCARRGRPVYRALADRAEEGWVWQSSHLGGHRFAGNAVFLPEGLYFGRLRPGEAGPVLDEYLAGRIEFEHYRGRACYGLPEQAAERAVREATGLTGVDDLELVRGDGPRVTFRGGGRTFDVEVTSEPGPLTYLSCDADAPERRPRHSARLL